MSERKELGKIQRVLCGIGGYQDAMLGVQFVLGGDNWGVHSEFTGTWCPGMVDVGQYTKWTEDDRTRHLADAMRKIGEVLRDAKRDDVSKLVGVPVEVTFEGNTLKSWRVLKEVL